MKKQSPDISFILPIYKTPKDFFIKCVQSILKQTHENIEIILVDDGSPDNCPSLCDSFAKDDSRITVIHQKNAGVGNARNTGLKKAKGTWVCFVDPDDWLEDTMAEQALNAINNSKTSLPIDVLFWNYIKEYGRTSEKIQYFDNEVRQFATKEQLQELHRLSIALTSGVGSIWAKLYRRDFLIAHKLFSNEDLPRGQDVEYNVRVFSYVKNALYVPSFSYNYRYDDNTASTAFNKHFKDYLIRFTNELYSDVINEENKEQLLKEVYIRAIHVILTISVRYTFHKNNLDPLYIKIKDFKNMISTDIFKKAIALTTYTDFSLPRRIALFSLKHSFVLGIYLIAKIRQFQYSIKQ